MYGDKLKASCELSKFIETLISPTGDKTQHNKAMHKFNSNKSLARYRYSKQKQIKTLRLKL